MEIQIINSKKFENGSFGADMIASGKTKASIWVSKEGRVNVVCQNASHRAFRGLGRCFHGGWQEAIDGYKSAAMKAMIRQAQEMAKSN